MEVYTGYGDKGMTDLSHTKNVSKSDDRICLMGSVEELMSHIGLVRVLIDDVDVVRNHAHADGLAHLEMLVVLNQKFATLVALGKHLVVYALEDG